MTPDAAQVAELVRRLTPDGGTFIMEGPAAILRAGRDAASTILALQAEVERLERSYDKMAAGRLEWRRVAEAATARVARLEGVLREIAEEMTYPPHDPGNYMPPKGKPTSAAKKARAALEEGK